MLPQRNTSDTELTLQVYSFSTTVRMQHQDIRFQEAAIPRRSDEIFNRHLR